jgi:hypothetical protein
MTGSQRNLVQLEQDEAYQSQILLCQIQNTKGERYTILPY